MQVIFLTLVFSFTGLISAAAIQNEADILSALQSGNFARAAETASSAIKTDATNPDLWNFLGIARTELGQTEAARKAFERGLQLQPGSISINENLGLLYFRTADYRKAKTVLHDAIRFGSQNPAVRYSLVAAQLRTGEAALARKQLLSLEASLQNSADYWEERGRAEVSFGDAAAESDFLRATSLEPAKISAWNGAATAAERQGLDEKALAHLIQARSAAPEDPATLIHFANICIRRDLGPDAREAVEKVLARDPKNSEALFLLGRAYISTQDWQKALDRFGQFMVLRPDYAPAYYAMGWVNLQINKRDEARKDFKEALRLNPKYPDARYEWSQMDFDDGNVNAAANSLAALLRDAPSHVRAHLAFGDLLLRQDQTAQAADRFRRALQLDPKSSVAHYKLANALARLGQSEEAARERTVAAALISESKKTGRTQLRLVLPEKGMQ